MNKPWRTRAIASIHCAKRDIKLDEQSYRSLLQQYGGHTSSADMTDWQLKNVLAQLKKLGYQHKRAQQPKKITPQIKKIEALLADMKLPWQYAHKLAKHMYQRDRIDFCTAEQLTGIISALVKKAKKQGSTYDD